MKASVVTALVGAALMASPAAALDYSFLFNTSTDYFQGIITGISNSGNAAGALLTVSHAPDSSYLGSNYLTTGQYTISGGVPVGGYAVSYNPGNNSILTIGAGSQTSSYGPAGGGTVSATSPTTFGAAPEPATWGMMILGFGVAGAALRQKRKQGTRTAALTA